MLPRPVSKTKETCKSYESVIGTILNHADRIQESTGSEPIQDRNLRMAMTLLELETHVQPATYRYYKAAVIHAIQTLPGDMDEQVMEILEPEASEVLAEHEHAVAIARAANLTTLIGSQQRAEHLSTADWITLITALLSTRSKWAQPAALWLVGTLETGLRPCEWASAKMTGTTLVVENAKATNGRAHGTTRTLDLFRASKQAMSAIRQFMAVVRHHGPEGFEALYSGVRELIADVARRALGQRQRYPSLYTARHCFASRAKMTYPQHVVAALMGHASIYTAPRHYAAARFAKGGRPLAVEPSMEDVMSVKRLQAARAAANYLGDQAERQ